MILPILPPWVKSDLRVSLLGSNPGGAASDVIVCWTQINGGTTDPGTGGNVGGVEVFLSGSMRGYGHESEPKNVLRQFAEVQAGDLILDLDADPTVALFPGQTLSGAKPLADLEGQGLRYVWGGRYYVSKEVTPDLQTAWDVILGNQRLHRTLLLKRET